MSLSDGKYANPEILTEFVSRETSTADALPADPEK
jgi:hypothetical protein